MIIAQGYDLFALYFDYTEEIGRGPKNSGKWKEPTLMIIWDGLCQKRGSIS